MLGFLSMYLEKIFDLFAETNVPGLNVSFLHFFFAILIFNIFFSVIWFISREDK